MMPFALLGENTASESKLSVCGNQLPHPEHFPFLCSKPSALTRPERMQTEGHWPLVQVLGPQRTCRTQVVRAYSPDVVLASSVTALGGVSHRGPDCIRTEFTDSFTATTD